MTDERGGTAPVCEFTDLAAAALLSRQHAVAGTRPDETRGHPGQGAVVTWIAGLDAAPQDDGLGDEIPRACRSGARAWIVIGGGAAGAHARRRAVAIVVTHHGHPPRSAHAAQGRATIRRYMGIADARLPASIFESRRPGRRDPVQSSAPRAPASRGRHRLSRGVRLCWFGRFRRGCGNHGRRSRRSDRLDGDGSRQCAPARLIR